MKKIFIIFLLLFSIQISFAQKNDDNEYATDDEVEEFEGLKDEKKKLDLSRFRVGGDFGFSLGGQGVVAAEVSPIIGYQIIRDRLEIGPGLVYQHLSQAKVYAENNVGGQAYLRGYIWQGIFVQVDGFLVNFNYKYIGTNRTGSFTYGNGFVGAGYAFNHKEAPFYISLSVKTNMVIDQFYPTRRIIPKIGFQFRL